MFSRGENFIYSFPYVYHLLYVSRTVPSSLYYLI